MKVYDSNGKRIRVGDKVVCIKASEIAPYAEDSEIGRIFTVTGVGFVNSVINPGNNIILDCHPIFDYERGMEYVAAKPERFLKICSSQEFQQRREVMESARVATVEEFAHAVIQITKTVTIRNGKEWAPYEQIRQMLTTRDAAIRAECADRAWPLLKQEYEWRHEDSECGGNEISEGLDMLKIRLRATIMGEEGR